MVSVQRVIVVMVVMVMVWTCLIMISEATPDDTFNTYLRPLPLLDHGHSEPHSYGHYILANIQPSPPLPIEFTGNTVVEDDDLIPSVEFNEGGVEEASVPESLWNPTSSDNLYYPKLKILPPITSSGILQDARTSNQILRTSLGHRNVYPISITRRKDSGTPLKRQKRYTFKHKLRSIAVPLSVFNFLGFLPVRVPGLPYHNDLPSPDYTYYNTKYDVLLPRYRRRKTFRRF